ncbi:tRNA (adenosine(37)-N6)-threonylcarbamoyltransferase complex transferase subunit TsaD [Ammonifex thiophilus]|uniref:tRNA N6-adenosine threonylcarbamoyltransferase n=1 Tax=Ammonifex thiophilus TaxID=444093 RepID=A0A3D8P712_9THEO|nr:tRNA (adenosine(37)-N6)-threonylcarbamoyltransferase complex transferase subunit TsaD [Ammonifex thiophilus]RDV84338.1 tRNA (adenosine(37)-N6)-threonylcarbamoyltransferase complex transferase subunit TsaD [Ammonifex thiophilus]
MKNGRVLILGIETSCDETAAAVVADGREILSNVVSSQVEIHRRFGGVVPEVASRKHLEMLNPVIDLALKGAGVSLGDLDAVAVTQGPGLLGSLLVGLMVAKSLAFVLRLPLIAVHHIRAHVYANFLAHPRVNFPFVALVVSGGHTDLIYATSHSDFRLIGRTKDDAAGEAFDKVARFLGLGYPGGPAIERKARQGDPTAFPLPRLHTSGDFDTSFSGLKTAVIYRWRQAQERGEKVRVEDVAASFQATVVEILEEKAFAAVRAFKVPTLLLAGGVAANGHLRERFATRAQAEGVKLLLPPPVLCTDNAAMVAAAAYYQFLRGDFAPLTVSADAGLPLS